MEYYFQTSKLSVGYHKQPLLEPMDITIQKGEILTLIGPNGAGKSTVLKSIAGQLAPLGGVMYLEGCNVGTLSGSDLSKKMAVLLTQRLRTELMTCEEVVATGRYPYTGHFGVLSKADEQAVAEAMDMVSVTQLKDMDFTCISDGQRQRVMLARAICQEPEMIILDEPTSYLDVKYKLEFLSILQKMARKKGLTVIMSLHELELAERISDKILCINGECVERFGTPKEVFVQGYLSHLFHIEAGRLDEENLSMELEAPKGEPKVFVIAGGGSGRREYRALQRQGTAFVTGILYENDLDYPAAHALAAEVITAKAFEPIDDSLLEEAKRKLMTCQRVICCREHFGSLEGANRKLYEYAKEAGKVQGER